MTDMEKRIMTIINNSKFRTEELSTLANMLLQGRLAPSFYLVCCPPEMDGLSLTNLDKPTIIIRVKDLEQFSRVFVHELTHLQQHAKGYTDEAEATREVIMSDKTKPNGERVI